MRRRKWSKSLIRTMPLSLSSGTFASGLFIFLASFSLLVSGLFPERVEAIRVRANDAIAPVLGAFSNPIQDAGLFIRDVSGIAGLQAENQALRQENESLRQWYQTAMTLQSENNHLRGLMKLSPHPNARYVTARILSDSGYAFAKTVLIDAGQSEGVYKGQAVSSGEGIVGRIVEAGDSVSRVLLLNDINSRVPVMIEDDGQHAILAGQNGSEPILDHLPPDLQVKEGQRVITSGMGGVFPYGLPVGRVQIKDKKPVVKLFSNLNTLLYVRVINLPADPNLHQLSETQP